MSTASIFRTAREPLAASTTATKQPKRTAARADESKPPGIIDRILSGFTSDEEKLAQQRLELEARKEEALQRVSDYKNLKKARDNAALRLAKADLQLEEAKARREELASRLVRESWGYELDMYRTQPPWFGYQNLLALDAAIAAFPEARKHIESELEKAQENVGEFAKRHGLSSDAD